MSYKLLLTANFGVPQKRERVIIIGTRISPLKLWVLILLRQGILDTTLCDKICLWLVASRWFSPGTPFSSTNETDRHEITEILLKVAWNYITRQQNGFLLLVDLLCNLFLSGYDGWEDFPMY